MTIFFIIFSVFITSYFASIFEQMIRLAFDISKLNIDYITNIKEFFKHEETMKIFALLELGAITFILYVATNSNEKVEKSDTMTVAGKIEIPKAIGEGQHGTSRFLKESEKEELFELVEYNGKSKQELKKNTGLVIQMKKEKGKEEILCVTDDIHSIILGSTRSGKSRGTILQTIWLRTFSNKSMVISDPKGELFLYTKEYLEENGYKVIDFDLRQPRKGKHYNYMSNILSAIKENDIPKAIDYTWDLVSVLVGEPKGEPLWNNGECSVIASAILAVAMEADEKYCNLTNVYFFIANMCKMDENGEMYITKYFKTLPDTHPAKSVFSVAEISTPKTRSSFFSSALATLRLFTNWNIAEVTSYSDIDLKEIGNEKVAFFIIIPDEKTTLYSLVSLLINQIYTTLVEEANKCGGRLPVEVEFLLDEFGNFPVIPSFGSMLSVGAGRGMRFDLVLQDYQQLEKKYKDDYGNIKGNCQLTVYLKSTDPKTLEELSKRTGTYTVQTNSVNNSISSAKTFTKGNMSFSDSANMAQRSLLLSDEVGRIARPYSLVLMAGEMPGIFEIPDLSKYYANEEFGLGTPEHNKEVIIKRDSEREERPQKQPVLWEIWNKYLNSTTVEELIQEETKDEDIEDIKEKKVVKRKSFLD